MALYSLADFVVDLENQYDFLPKQCAGYRYDGIAPADFTVRVTQEDIQRERGFSPENQYSAGYLESVCAYRKLCMALPMGDAMLMHGSVISCNGRGIAFLARSGVGKTTHTMLWRQVYGELVRIINGDKPILRFFGGKVYAYGTPWAGKENLQTNGRVELTDICLIERSGENAVFQIDPAQRLDALMQQILLPAESAAAEKTLELVDRLLAACKFWIIRCNISAAAALTAHNAIIGENEGGILCVNS